MMNTSMAYAVELDGNYLIGQKDRLQRADNLRSLKGDYLLFSDLQGAISRTMAVESDIRYAEMMISRKLQEAGEFDEPVTIITHWKKKRGKNTTDVCFTALPSRRYFQYLDQMSQHPSHMVVLPLSSMLWEVLRKRARRRPAAVVFQHDRFADLMVGTANRVWYAGRAVAFDNSDEQVQSLWDTVRTDIRTVCDEYNQSIDTLYVITWIDSAPLPIWPESEELSIVSLDTEAFICDGESCQASLPGLIRAVRARPALAPAREKMLFGARRVLPHLNILLILAAAVGIAAGIWYQRQTNMLQQEFEQLQARADRIRAQVPASFESTGASTDYKPTLEFIDRLWASRRLPTYQQVLNDFSMGTDTTLQVKNLKADYKDAKVQVDVFGTMRASFEESYTAYQRLLAQLRRRGYRILEERFDTRIRNSDFTLKLVKEAR